MRTTWPSLCDVVYEFVQCSLTTCVRQCFLSRAERKQRRANQPARWPLEYLTPIKRVGRYELLLLFPSAHLSRSLPTTDDKFVCRRRQATDVAASTGLCVCVFANLNLT